MTDRSLLELAAKAIGQRLEWVSVRLDGNVEPRLVTDNPYWFNWPTWNPLEDDGDALRLAVRCGIGMVHHQGWGQILHPSFEARIDFNYEGNAHRALRHAIVRAAAELGKGQAA